MSARDPAGAGQSAAPRLWGGAFESEVDPVIDAYTRSLPFDHRLAAADLVGCLAHARMLFETGVIDPASSRAILKGLSSLLLRVEAGELDVGGRDEDVHTWIERQLTEEIGDAGRRLHTARSRNDQTAVALRLWQRSEVEHAVTAAVGFAAALIDHARQHTGTAVPGYTHMQRAQPTSLAQHLLAHAWSVLADAGRLRRAHRTAGLCPLGAGAMAGSPHRIDPERSAELLGMEAPYPNTMWAVADRDYAAEALFACALTMVHLSRWAEEVVLWTSSEFGFARLQDRAAKGSSIMPQKKNPEPAEILRGKSGRAVGNLVSLLVTIKGLPLTYNSDLQEDKEAAVRRLRHGGLFASRGPRAGREPGVRPRSDGGRPRRLVHHRHRSGRPARRRRRAVPQRPRAHRRRGPGRPGTGRRAVAAPDLGASEARS